MNRSLKLTSKGHFKDCIVHIHIHGAQRGQSQKTIHLVNDVICLRILVCQWAIQHFLKMLGKDPQTGCHENKRSCGL
jgi:hypothetical protein